MSPQRQQKFLLLGLLNLAASILTGFYGHAGFSSLRSGDFSSDASTYYWVTLYIGIPLFFLLSSLRLLLYYFRKADNDKTAPFVYAALPWVLLGIMLTVSTLMFLSELGKALG